MSDWVDTWARQVAQRITRRQMLGGIGALTAGGALGVLGPGAIAEGRVGPLGITASPRTATLTCPAGYVHCGSICCDPGGTCIASGATLTCSNACGGNAHLQLCDGVCQDVYYDPDNCGYCGHVCPPPPPNSKGKATGTATCSAGTCGCTCNNGLRECIDANGRCHCVTGACLCNTKTCPSPNTCCGGVCTNTTTDLYNCGTCGHACECQNGFTAACVNSSCVCQCLPPNIVCGSVCINPYTDPSNCGTCGNVCSNHCTPPPGFTTICDGGRCANTETIVQYC